MSILKTKKNKKKFNLSINTGVSRTKKNYLSGESGIQVAVISYLKAQYPHVIYCASAGGVRTSFKQAVKMKMNGYVKGFPDLQICEPMNGYHGLFLEIKTEIGIASKEQKEWVKQLNERGYVATICKGFDQCKEAIDNYFSNDTGRINP